MEKTIKRLFVWALIVAALLMIPLVTSAPWTGSDFVFAGGVLFGAGVIYELVTRNMNNKIHQALVGLAVAATVFLIWGWAVAGP